MSILYFSKFSDITKASLSFLKSMKGGGRLVMRLGTGNEYIGTTLCLSSLLMTETASIFSVRISYQHDGISSLSCIHGERTGRLVMRTGFGNQSNGYVGTTLCLLSLLFHANSIKKYVSVCYISQNSQTSPRHLFLFLNP